ncbi:MAG: hypothetical protein NTZ10_02295 [Candidatus Saganbacteria bacterium]|nr:hypothetical protein [Candidatus Saganbacteria bacterium]
MKRLIFILPVFIFLVLSSGCGKSPVGVVPESATPALSSSLSAVVPAKSSKVSGRIILSDSEMAKMKPVSGEAVLCSLEAKGGFAVTTVATSLAADASYILYISPEAVDRLYFVRVTMAASKESLIIFAPVYIKKEVTSEVVADVSSATTYFSLMLSDIVKNNEKLMINPKIIENKKPAMLKELKKHVPLTGGTEQDPLYVRLKASLIDLLTASAESAATIPSKEATGP